MRASVTRILFRSGRPLLLASLLGLVGCDASDKSEVSPPAERAQSTAESDALPSASDQWPSPTEQECELYAHQFLAALADKNVPSVNRLIEWNEILARATGGGEMKQEVLDQFLTGARVGIAGESGLASQLVDLSDTGGSYTFLRVRNIDDRPRVLFRLLQADGAVNYHEMVMARSPSNEPIAVDIYVYSSAERISQSFRRVFLPIAADSDRNFIEKLTGQESAFVQHLDTIREMTEALRMKQFPEVLRVYQTLPESLRKEKNIQLMRQTAAMQSSDEEYVAALKDFRRYHPMDPCMDMISIDFFVLQKEYDKSLSCIDSLDRAIGGDPFLDVMRGNILLAKEDLAGARRAFTAAIDAEPTLLDAYWGEVAISLAQQDHAATLQLLRSIHNMFPVQFEDLTEIAEYAEFVKSPEYQEWNTLLNADEVDSAVK